MKKQKKNNLTQEDFWSLNPCDIDGNFKEISDYRYSKEPYLPIFFKDFNNFLSDNSKILEIGCGQGTDALHICSNLSKNNHYLGIDYSPESIKVAIKNREILQKNGLLRCIPHFQQGDALNLNLENESIDFIYSMGVLHHTPSLELAIDEIYRVLKKGGYACIYLYRTRSLKVEVAKLLRKFQKILDFFLGTELSIYKILKNRKSKNFGTMFLECFGVPILKSVSRSQIRIIFSRFSKISFTTCGNNFHFLNKLGNGIKNRFGVYYKIDLIK